MLRYFPRREALAFMISDIGHTIIAEPDFFDMHFIIGPPPHYVVLSRQHFCYRRC